MLIIISNDFKDIRKDLTTTIGCKIHMHDDFLLSFLVKLVALIILHLHYSLSSIICLSLHRTIESSLKFKPFYACQINGVSSLSISPFLGSWFPWVKLVVGGYCLVSKDRCNICSKIEGNDTVLSPKLDTLHKHDNWNIYI
jgi:hypothetical protein